MDRQTDQQTTRPIELLRAAKKRGGDWKKTFPMKGKVFFTGDIHTYIHSHGHPDSMTESAQWANSVKRAVESVTTFHFNLPPHPNL